MSSEAWKAAHGRGRQNRPGINDIKAFLPGEAGALFEAFSKHLAREYGIHCKPPVFMETDGWVYSFGRSSVSFINHVSIEDGGFVVNGRHVSNAVELAEAIQAADRLYADGFADRFDRETALKNERQKQSTQRRLARERAELDQLSGLVDRERFNRYRWSPKLQRRILKRLYENDAKGICDEALLDDVGYTLYARCLQGRDERLIMESGRLKCHQCGAVLDGSRSLMQCACGGQYLFRDYMRSFRKENMPSGAATPIFNAFVEAWPGARGYAAKMRLVDGLIHEFHVNLNSGVKGRFVGVNLIEGSKKQIGELILELAYGGGDSTQRFVANLQRE